MMEGRTKSFIDVASVVNVVAVLINVLPALAALATLIWTFFRTLESPGFHAFCYRAFGWRVDRWIALPKKDDEA